jgi:hypothetical protein
MSDKEMHLDPYAEYPKVLSETDFEAIYQSWVEREKAKKQAPVIRKEKRQRRIWENLFAYGVGLGVLVQVALWLRRFGITF